MSLFKHKIKSLFVAITVIFSVCLSTLADTPANFAGWWDGEWISSYGYQDWISVEIQQNGTQLSGSMDVATTYSGNLRGIPITGSVSGNKANFSATYTDWGYTYRFQYTNATLIPPQNPDQGGVYITTGSYTITENGSLWDRGTFRMVDESFVGDRLPRPDLTIQKINLNPATPVAGRDLSMEIIIANIGESSASSGYLKIYHEENEANAQMIRFSTLRAGQQKTIRISEKMSALQGFTLLNAEIDPGNAIYESDEDNNTLEVVYTGGEPQVDVAVTDLTLSPDSVPEGGSFNASVTIRNIGTETADAGYLQIFFDGNPVGRETRVSRLNAGAEKTIRVSRAEGFKDQRKIHGSSGLCNAYSRGGSGQYRY